MNLYLLAFRNVFRNRTRAFLTMGGIAVLVFAFIFLRTVIGAFYGGTEKSANDLLVVRNRVSLTFPLPASYVDRVRNVPGVTAASNTVWFGGTYKDRRNFFPQFAVDPTNYFKVFAKTAKVSPEDLQAFEADRAGCLVGTKLAKKYGFKKGDVIKLKGEIYPGDWSFNVRGVIDGTDGFSDTCMFFQYDYLDKSLPADRQGYTGAIYVLINNPAQSPQVCRTIDGLFDNSANETLTESQQAFTLGFVSGSSAIINALQAVSVVLLVIMLLILGNTLAMAVRERTGEIAVLRSIGFVPRQILWLCIGEGMWLAVLGGIVGVAISQPILTGFGKAINGFLNVPPASTWALPALLISLVAGFISSFIPAVRASQVDVVTALRRAE